MDLVSTERFDRPSMLWLLAIGVLIWWLSRRSLAGIGPVRSKIVIAWRCLVLLLLVLALSGLHKILKNDDLSVLFVLDVSRSISPESRREAERFIIDASQNMRPKDRAALLTFDGQTSIEQLPTAPGPEGGMQVQAPFPDGQRPDQSNLSHALRMAQACAQNDTNNRIVVISDGNQNVGDAIVEAKAAFANRITIDVVPLSVDHGAEVVFEQLRAPPYANLNEQIPLRLILQSDRKTSGEIRIYQRVGENDQLIDLDPTSDRSGEFVELNEGKNPFTITLPILTDRGHEFRAEFVPAIPGSDVIAENNIAVAFTNVEGPQTVLFIGSETNQSEDQLLVEALQREDIRVDWITVTGDSVDLRPSVVQDYSAIILANVGANYFSSEQQHSLANYVRDMGGGLIMIGGDDSFGAGGWQGSVVEGVMPVKFDVDAVRQIPRGALAIVMHSCEMPAGNKWGIETAVAALKAVSRLDYYGVVGWGIGGFHWEVQMQVAANKDNIIRKIRKMQNADMFDFETPMGMAYQALMNCKDAAQRHMIIISDGDPSAPSPGLLNRMKGNRITCSTVSIFPHGGAEIGTMRDIAKKTGGEYYSLSKPGDEKRLPKIFTKEAKVVRRPLIRDEVFKPKINSNLSDIMLGLGNDFPELKGYVVTTPRKASDVEMPLVTKRGDPLLAHWLCGFGRAVAFTSGRWKHWGEDWAEWSGFSKVWAQTVRWSMQQGTAANYDVATFREGEEGHIIIESMDDEKGFANIRQFRGRVVRPDGGTETLQLTQTGPGRYEAKFSAVQKGSYFVSVMSDQTAKEKPVLIRSGLTVAYSPEYKDLSVNEALLAEMAEEGRGRQLSLSDKGEKVFEHNLKPAVSRTPIWDFILKLAVLAFLLDVAFRRVAIDPVKIIATARRYIASIAGTRGTGKAAAATLGDLRTVRDKARTDKTASGQEPAPSVGRPTMPTEIPGPSASAKFDAGASLKKPAKDLTEALSGNAGQAAPPPMAPEKKDAGPQESMTARLLKARKRAQDQHDKSE